MALPVTGHENITHPIVIPSRRKPLPVRLNATLAAQKFSMCQRNVAELIRIKGTRSAGRNGGGITAAGYRATYYFL
jgi:hypothetical protein